MSAGERAAARPFCAEEARGAAEPLAGTASRVEHWLLVEYAGYWPFEPLEAAVFAGTLRQRLAEQLGRLPHARLLLVKRPGRDRGDGVSVVYGRSGERGGWLRRLELGAHPDLLGFDVAAAVASAAPPGAEIEHPLLIACTHGVRDRCCARYGQELCRALHEHADPAWVWQSTHVGGDRFAGNLVVLPEGLYFGWVGGDDAERVLAAYLGGRIDLDHYRGRSSHPFPAQAADAYVRRTTGLDGLHDVRLVGGRRTAAGAWTVRFLAEVSGVVHEVDVAAELRGLAYLTCKSGEPKRARRYVVRAHRRLDA